MESYEAASVPPVRAVGDDDGAAATAYLLWCVGIAAAAFFPYARAWGVNLLAFSNNTIRIGFAALAILGLLIIRRPNWFAVLTRLGDMVHRAFSGLRGGIALALLVGILASLLASREAFLGDGTLRAEDAMRGANVLPSEVMASGLAALVGRSVPATWGMDGYMALRIVSIVFAVLLAIGLWWLAPKTSDSGRRTLGFWVLTFGSVRLLAGYMETYTSALAAFILVTMAAVAYQKGRVGATTVILLWVAAMLSHVTAVLLIPMVLWSLMRQPDGNLRWNTARVRAFAIVAVLLGGAVIGAFYIFQVRLAGATTGHFLMPLMPAPPHNYAIFSWAHVLDFTNEVALLAPAFLVGLIARLFFLRRKQQAATAAGWYADPRMFWILAAALPVAAGFLVDPKLGWARDWDLYAVMFSPALVGAAIWLDGRSAAVRRAAGVVAVMSAALWLSFSVDSRAERVRFEQLLDLDPTRSDYGHEIMAQYYRRHDDYENVIRHYRQSLAVSENLRYRLNIAAGYGQVGRYDEAERWYRGVLARDSTSSEAYHGLALALSEMRRPDEAMQYAEKAYALNPKDPDYVYRFGSVLLEMEKFPAALPYLERSARALPLQGYRLNSLAVCYLALNRTSEARAAIDAALRLEPEEAVVWLNAARVAWGGKDIPATRRFLAEYETRTPADSLHPQARMLADSLTRLTGGL